MTNRITLPPYPPPRTVTVAEALLEQLRLWGITKIYGVVGDAVFGLLDALAHQDDIAFISVKHESTAAMMASAEAKLTGKPGVCLAQMGPGLANLINGLGDAYMDNAPVLAITGEAPLNKIGTPYKQSVNQQEMISAVASYSRLVVHPDAAVESLSQAMKKALFNRSVSHLSIPKDLFQMDTQLSPQLPSHTSIPVPDRVCLQRAIELMSTAERPMLLVGSGIQVSREKLHELADVWSCGIALSYGAIGIVSESHPHMLNGLGEGGNPYLTELFKESDVVFALETDWWPDGMVPLNARVIQAAKQPGSFSVSLPMDTGLAGDLTAIVEELTSALKKRSISNPLWLERIQRCKQTWLAQNESEGSREDSPLHPACIIRAVERHVAEDAVICLDEGDSTLWFLRNFRAARQQILLSNRWRTMGYGLPAAMAAKLCLPQKQIVCLTGDGGLAMVLADLLTAKRYGLRITVIVFNNGALQMEKDKMLMTGLHPEGTSLTNPDFAKVAEACGWVAYPVAAQQQLNEALKQAKSASSPVLIDAITAPTPHPDFQTTTRRPTT